MNIFSGQMLVWKIKIKNNLVHSRNMSCLLASSVFFCQLTYLLVNKQETIISFVLNSTCHINLMFSILKLLIKVEYRCWMLNCIQMQIRICCANVGWTCMNALFSLISLWSKLSQSTETDGWNLFKIIFQAIRKKFWKVH